VEDSLQANHTTSLAQLISELPTARDTNATIKLKNAPSPMMDHSQMNQAAMMLVQRISLMLNVIKTRRNANLALKEKKIATPLPSVMLPAESLMQSVIQAQVNALLATLKQTKTAHKLRMHVAKNAQLCHSLSATIPQESAVHVRTVLVVSQMLHAKIHANQDHHQANFMSAAGIQLFQSASKLKRVL